MKDNNYKIEIKEKEIKEKEIIEKEIKENKNIENVILNKENKENKDNKILEKEFKKKEQTQSQDSVDHAPCGLHCIQMKNIGVKIGSTYLVEHVNLHIHCGKLTVIIGKNGAGKSTLIKAIVGELKHEGTIEFTDMKENRMKDLKVGYVPQHLNIAKNTPTSVYDFFAGYISRVPVFLKKSKKVYTKIQEHLALFEAGDLIDKPVGDLSGGELQRVLLSIATMPLPNLLLLDEPVSGIDQRGMELFYQIIDDLRKNYDLAMVLVSHDFDFVLKYADYVILLDKTIVKEGTPEEVLSSKEFKDIFGTNILSVVGGE